MVITEQQQLLKKSSSRNVFELDLAAFSLVENQEKKKGVTVADVF